ncbi:MAG: hypothetical protein KatS3mg105_4221 [Gemmatales bacterium]|nr:MAG: hypothetical protein KatS3mg105_4221 [Gemmatales bacterium]
MSVNLQMVPSDMPTGRALAELLESGELVYYPVCPFPLPEGKELEFLLSQKLGRFSHKNISYDPIRDKAHGFRRRDEEQAHRLRELLADFSRIATHWLAGVLPQYASAWKLDRVSFRPLEEATRCVRQTARNDLLHIDAFPTRPTRGYRLLRLFVNINPTEPRVWITGERFDKLLERFGDKIGLPKTAANPGLWLRNWFLKWFGLRSRSFTPYDEFMLKLHHFLKSNDEFQERSFKRYWQFPPGSAWLVMTDAVCHAALRGRYALEHSYFISPQTLALPELSPAALLQHAVGARVVRRAA